MEALALSGSSECQAQAQRRTSSNVRRTVLQELLRRDAVYRRVVVCESGGMRRASFGPTAIQVPA